MSLSTPLENLEDDVRGNVLDELTIRIDPGKYGRYVRSLYAFAITGTQKMITAPFFYAQTRMRLSRPKRKALPSCGEYEFTGTLRDEQQQVKKEAVKALNRRGTIVLSLHCGFGKTVTSIGLARQIGLRTLIIVNKVVLMTQWRDSIMRFCPGARIRLLKPALKLPNDDEIFDFYIVNAVNVPKFFDTETGRTLLSSIGTVIVDECHLIMAETLVQSLLHLEPRYMIGLSATPYRPDALDQLLDLYFGPERIVRKLFRRHIVYKVESGFEPRSDKNSDGILNWGAILDSQARDESRNQLLVDIICNHSDRTFLVLTKRIIQGETLIEMLRNRSVTCTSLLGSQQSFDRDARVLVGTIAKVGTGFDHDKLNALLLASDVEEYFIQYLGRIFRTSEGDPLVFDIVDNHPVLRKHYTTRKATYMEHGGEIRPYRRLLGKGC